MKDRNQKNKEILLIKSFLNTKGKKWWPLNQRSSAEKERCEAPWKHRIF